MKTVKCRYNKSDETQGHPKYARGSPMYTLRDEIARCTMPCACTYCSVFRSCFMMYAMLASLIPWRSRYSSKSFSEPLYCGRIIHSSCKIASCWLSREVLVALVSLLSLSSKSQKEVVETSDASASDQCLMLLSWLDAELPLSLLIPRGIPRDISTSAQAPVEELRWPGRGCVDTGVCRALAATNTACSSQSPGCCSQRSWCNAFNTCVMPHTMYLRHKRHESRTKIGASAVANWLHTTDDKSLNKSKCRYGATRCLGYSFECVFTGQSIPREYLCYIP